MGFIDFEHLGVGNNKTNRKKIVLMRILMGGRVLNPRLSVSICRNSGTTPPVHHYSSWENEFIVLVGPSFFLGKGNGQARSATTLLNCLVLLLWLDCIGAPRY